MDSYFIPVIIAGVIGGASISLLGTVIVGMRIPFIGIYVSHGAMVGAVFGALAGLAELPASLAGALAAALLLGYITPPSYRRDENIAIGILFSVSMALVFLGMGLIKDGRMEMLALLWGNLLYVNVKGLYFILGIAFVLVIFFALFSKELKAIIFSRTLAAASGIHETFVWISFLILSSLIITANLRVVGGLMIYSLMTNPPAAAFKLCRGFTQSAVVSSIFGALSGVGGLAVSYYMDLPVGACIALFSAAIFGVALIISRFRSLE